MVVTRRVVLRAATAAPIALAAGGLSSAWSPAWAAATSPYSRSTWEPLVGRTFTLVGERDGTGTAPRARAVLSSLEDLHGARHGARQRFSLVFTADHDLPEGTVTVRRRGFGSVSLFVTAVDRGVEAQHRQAVINRI